MSRDDGARGLKTPRDRSNRRDGVLRRFCKEAKRIGDSLCVNIFEAAVSLYSDICKYWAQRGFIKGFESAGMVTMAAPDSLFSEILMSSLNALSTAAQNRLCAALSPYESDRLKYGPAAASLIGIGSSLADGASTVCHLSSEGLQKVAELAGGLGEAADTAVAFVEDVADTVADAAEAVSDGVGSFLTSAGDYLALGAAAVAETINEVV